MCRPPNNGSDVGITTSESCACAGPGQFSPQIVYHSRKVLKYNWKCRSSIVKILTGSVFLQAPAQVLTQAFINIAAVGLSAPLNSSASQAILAAVQSALTAIDGITRIQISVAQVVLTAMGIITIAQEALGDFLRRSAQLVINSQPSEAS